MPSSGPQKEFDQLILEAVDDALSVLGDEPVKRAFYYHLEKRASIKREEVPRKLGEFHKALTGLFYDGSVILEKRISRSLCAKFHLELPADHGPTLTDIVREARHRYVTQ